MTVTPTAVDACLFSMLIVLTLRVVLAPGVATISVVVADEIAVFVRPGVTVLPLKSTHDA